MSEKKIKLKIESAENRNWDDVYRRISWWDSDKVAKAKVMVVGAGALGNEVLKNLALLNVGNILIVDFDIIEYDNLSRSALFRKEDCKKKKAFIASERVQSINPNVKTMYIDGDISIDVGLGVFKRMDVVIGCLDNRVARLYINRHCYKVGKTWVDGAIENLAGQLDVFKPGLSCYECQLDENEWANIRYRWGCPDVAQRNATFGKIPTTPISASIIGAMQVQEALKVIYKNERQSLAGQRFKYEGMNNMILQYESPPLREDCLSHALIDKVIEADELSASSTIDETLTWLQNYFSDPNPMIVLDDELVEEITTKESEVSHEVLIIRGHLSESFIQKYRQVPGEQIMITKSIRELGTQFSQLDKKLKEIGIPPLHILTVQVANDICFVELSGDKDFLDFTMS